MASVRGTFSVENLASQPLRDMRSEAQLTKQAFRDLGNAMSRVGAERENLDAYRASLRDMRGDARDTMAEVRAQWDSTTRSVSQNVSMMRADMDSLEEKMDRLSQKHARPDIDLKGFDESMAKLELLEAKLDEINRKRATPSVGASTAGARPVSGNADSMENLTHEMIALRSWQRSNPNFWNEGGAVRTSTTGGGGGALVGRVGSSVAGAGASGGESLAAGLPALGAKAGLALPAVSSLAGAAAALLSSMTGAALGTGALALSGGGALAMGIGAVASVAVPTVKRLGEAWQAAEQYRQAISESRMSGMQQTEMLHAVVQAEDSLQQSQVQSRLAQIALTEARREARNELVNLRLATQSASLGEKQASLQLTSARRSLYATETSPTSTPLEVEQSKLGVAQAELGIRQSRQLAFEAHQKEAVARYQTAHGGVVAVQSARQGAVTASQAVRNAGWSLEQARYAASGRQAAEQARLQEQYALSFLPPGARQVLEAGHSAIETWRRRASGASGMFTNGILGGTVGTVRSLAPTLAHGSTIAMGGLLHAGEGLGQWLKSPEDRQFLITGSKMFAENITTGEHVLTNVLTTIQHIMLAFRPFLHEIGVTFEHWTAGWAKGTSNIASTREHLRGMVNDMEKWTDMWMEFWRLLHSIMVAGGANAQGTGLVESFTLQMREWEGWVTTNPQKVRDFFSEAIAGAKTLAEAFGEIVKTLAELARAFGPVLQGAGGLFRLASETGILGSPVGVAGLIVGRRALGRTGIGKAAAGEGALYGAGASGGGSASIYGAGSLPLQGEVRRVSTTGRPSIEQGYFGQRSFVAGPVGRETFPSASRIYQQANEGSYTPPGWNGPMYVGSASAPTLFEAAGAKLRAFGARVASVGEEAGRAVAPFALLQGGLELAAGRNPLASPVQAALMGGSLPMMLGGGWKAGVAGAGAGLLASGVTSGNKVTAGIGGALSGAMGGMALGGLEGTAFGGPVGAIAGAAIGGTVGVLGSILGGGGGESAAQRAQRQNERLAHTVEKATKAYREAQAASETAYRGMAGAAAESLPTLERFVKRHAWQITQELGASSLQAKEMLATNSYDGAMAYKHWMEYTMNWTTKGIAFVNRQLRAALGRWGIHVSGTATGSLAETQQLETAASLHTEPVTGATNAAQKAPRPAFQGNPTNSSGEPMYTGGARATGGRLGGMGLEDSISTPFGRVAPGELVVNRHTEAEANRDLVAAGKPSLSWRVTNQTIPHSYPMHYATGGYVNPIGAGAAPSRIDMGVDYSGKGVPVRALGAGLITNAGAGTGGWGPYWINEQLSGGPYAGRHIYYAEGVTPSVHSGEWVHAGQRIGTLNGGMEIGFATGSGNSTTSVGASEGFTGANSTAAGVAMSNLIGALGGPRGIVQGKVAGHFAGALRGGLHLKIPHMGGEGLLAAIANGGLGLYGGALEAKYGHRSSNVAGHGGSPSANERLGRAMMVARGYAASEWPYLQRLWTRESGWNAYAVNPTSGAAGIAQSLGHGPVPLGNARSQIGWGLGYISERYGTPRGAWEHEVADGWYARGGRLGYAGAFRHGGSFTTRPNEPVAFVAGDSPVPEDVHVAPHRPGVFATATGGHHIEIHFGDIVVQNGEEIKDKLGEAADLAARRLIAALDRHSQRRMIGIAQD